MAKLAKFVPLTKMEEQSDGTLHVFGTVTAELPDLDNEVCDYEGTKPYYKAKVDALFKLTSAVPGMTPSIMPMREMHQLVAIGAGRSIEFDDAAKAIKMGFHVIEPTAVAKFKAGVLVGFSQGGAYVGEMIADPVHKGCKRYIADPAEVSAVDSPCLPSALVETMKGRTVTLQKASGATEQVPLEIISLDTHRMTKMEAEIAELRRRLGEKAVALAERDKAAIARACAKLALQKGLYEVGWLGSLIEDLTYLCMQSEFERDMEGDKSKVPDQLRGTWEALLETFKQMAIEEADEAAAAGGQGEKGMKITDQAGLTKAAKTLADHLDKHMEMHKALHEKMEGTLSKDHPIMKAHQAMMDHCEKCMKAAKDAGAGEEPEGGEKVAPVAADAVVKAAVDAAVAPLKTQLDELVAKLAKTPAAGGPHSGTPAPVVKSTPTPFDELVPATAVTH